MEGGTGTGNDMERTAWNKEWHERKDSEQGLGQ
jgi:hypothetical protein